LNPEWLIFVYLEEELSNRIQIYLKNKQICSQSILNIVSSIVCSAGLKNKIFGVNALFDILETRLDISHLQIRLAFNIIISSTATIFAEISNDGFSE
jgi:hypothetical protein